MGATHRGKCAPLVLDFSSVRGVFLEEHVRGSPKCSWRGAEGMTRRAKAFARYAHVLLWAQAWSLGHFEWALAFFGPLWDFYSPDTLGFDMEFFASHKEFNISKNDRQQLPDQIFTKSDHI